MIYKYNLPFSLLSFPGNQGGGQGFGGNSYNTGGGQGGNMGGGNRRY